MQTHIVKIVAKLDPVHRAFLCDTKIEMALSADKLSCYRLWSGSNTARPWAQPLDDPDASMLPTQIQYKNAHRNVLRLTSQKGNVFLRPILGPGMWEQADLRRESRSSSLKGVCSGSFTIIMASQS